MKTLLKKMLCLMLGACMLLGAVPVTAAEDVQEEKPLVFDRTISAAEGHTAVIKEDGSLWTWGFDNCNRLGLGLAEPVRTPTRVPLEKRVVSVEAASFCTSVITEDGELWNWGGHDANGKLGREADGDNIPPGKVLSGVKDHSGGATHSAALTVDGTLWTWGANSCGELGIGLNKGSRIFEGLMVSYDFEPLPMKVMTGVADVESGSNCTFAITEDGTLWGWGDNSANQLGVNWEEWELGKEDKSVLGKEVEIPFAQEEGEFYTADGTLWTIHASSGVNTYYVRENPVRIMDNVAQVESDYRTIVLTKDGDVWVFGDSVRVEDDRKGVWYTYAPQYVMTDVVRVATGGLTFAAIKSDGSLWMWGGNAAGKLGQGAGNKSLIAKDAVKVMDDVVDVAIGENFVAALKNDGSLWMWGQNYYGELGVEPEKYDNEKFMTVETPIKVMDGVALPSYYVNKGLTIGAADPTAEVSSDLGAVTAGMQIPSEATLIDGNYYIYYRNPDNWTWQEAKEYCERVGGHLATLNTANEINAVADLEMWLFTGGYRDNYGRIRWVTDEPWTCNIWWGNEPNNEGGQQSCIGIYGGRLADIWPTSIVAGFLCEWETSGTASYNAEATYSLTFEPVGGTLDTQWKAVANGQPYGYLPTPTREGLCFVGWYTWPDGGELVTSESIVQLNGDQWLYAVWRNPEAGPTVNEVSFKFGNNHNAFDYKSDFKIKYERYVTLFGQNKASLENYNKNGLWGGSCFGMSSTAAMLYMGNVITPVSFNEDAWYASQLGLSDKNATVNMTLLEFIETMQILQRSSAFKKNRDGRTGKYNELVRAVSNFQKNGTEPVIIAMWGPTKDGNRSGHAVLALNVWADPDNKYRDYIEIYDPNFPGDGRRVIDLYKNNEGKYTAWHYYLNDTYHWGTGYKDSEGKDSTIAFSTYSDVMSVWNNRGKETALTASTLSLNTTQASVYDYSGNLVATIRDGRVETFRADIYEAFDSVDGADSGEEKTVTLWVPSEYFMVVNEDESVETFEATVTGKDSALSTTTTANRMLVYLNEADETNTVMVDGDDASFEITMTSGSGEVKLSGSTAADMPTCFSSQGGQLKGFGVGLGQRSELTVDGKASSEIEKATVPDIILSSAPEVAEAAFNDLDKDSGYLPAVAWAVGRGVTNGTARGYFDPDRIVTRAEAITIIWRALGCPLTGNETMPFEDVEPGDYSYNAVLWAGTVGVACGVGEACFAPREKASANEVLTFIWRALGEPGRGAEFGACSDAAEWADELGLAAGTGAEGDLSAPCTRSDVVMFLYRLFG